ncbi:signal peptidase I [Candidatus Woesearchaeota archaeon]|nr:signal peptidase I [Candidatus Woesearchaeota archaeon]
MTLKKNLKKVWHFIWEEDSLASWIVNIVLAFVIIKFLIYPALGFTLGTTHPIVAVVSGSMEHKSTPICLEYESNLNPLSNCRKYSKDKFGICGQVLENKDKYNIDEFWDICGSWYQENNISKEDFENFRFKNGFNKGDVIILQSKKNVDVGDVIVFWSNYRNPIIHRVVEVNNNMYNTKGDHNSREDGFSENESVIGKALFRIPYLGWIKIWFVDLITIPLKIFN